MKHAWLAVLMATGCSGPLRARFEMTRAELQERLSEGFPIERGGTFLALVIHDPEVLLTDGSEEIGVRMTLSIGVGPMVRVPAGRLGVVGRLSYDRESSSLLLEEPHIHTIELTGPAREKEDEVKRLVNRVVEEVLPVVPLKKVEGGAGWMLKSVTVRDGSVWVEVGI
jgi:hypothetical protein